MAPRLRAGVALPASVRAPAYCPEDHGAGLVHLGLGAFHRAHQAVYTDDALGADGGDWRIVGASLRSTTAADELRPQDGRYSLIERQPQGPKARVIGSLQTALSLSTDRAALTAALRSPATKIVTLTVTEKAYGIDRATGGADLDHPAVAHDLQNKDAPIGVLGLLCHALRTRRQDGAPPFTVLCCDNLPNNGTVVRGGLKDFAARTDTALADHIAADVAFPSTMVDRITPARTQTTLDDALALTGYRDAAAIETEPFSQWVVEDEFPTGRPSWEAGGALMVKRVGPYEDMKLAMLNGAHSLIAYAGVVGGFALVRDAMADPAFRTVVRRHMAAAAATLEPVPGIALDRYADDLIERFENPHIAHATRQIAMDGTQKLPQRILAPAHKTWAMGGALQPFAFAAAAWMRYCLGRDNAGAAYALQDPYAQTIADIAAQGGDARSLAGALMTVGPLAASPLSAEAEWLDLVSVQLKRMIDTPLREVLAQEAAATETATQ